MRTHAARCAHAHQGGSSLGAARSTAPLCSCALHSSCPQIARCTRQDRAAGKAWSPGCGVKCSSLGTHFVSDNATSGGRSWAGQSAQPPSWPRSCCALLNSAVRQATRIAVWLTALTRAAVHAVGRRGAETSAVRLFSLPPSVPPGARVRPQTTGTLPTDYSPLRCVRWRAPFDTMPCAGSARSSPARDCRSRGLEIDVATVVGTCLQMASSAATCRHMATPDRIPALRIVTRTGSWVCLAACGTCSVAMLHAFRAV